LTPGGSGQVAKHLCLVICFHLVSLMHSRCTQGMAFVGQWCLVDVTDARSFRDFDLSSCGVCCCSTCTYIHGMHVVSVMAHDLSYLLRKVCRVFLHAVRLHRLAENNQDHCRYWYWYKSTQTLWLIRCFGSLLMCCVERTSVQRRPQSACMYSAVRWQACYRFCCLCMYACIALLVCTSSLPRPASPSRGALPGKRGFSMMH
jgi:hypothetical protein